MAWVIVDTADVVNRWRELTPGEASIAPTLIEDAQDELEDVLEDRGVYGVPEGNQKWVRRYIRVVSAMVRRVLQNPEGYLSTAVTVDDYRREYKRDSAVSAGVLYVTDAEINGMTPRDSRPRGAFSIVPG